MVRDKRLTTHSMRILGVREPFAMATPDYLEQVVISGRARSSVSGAPEVRFGAFHRPSVTSLIWASIDLLTVAVAAVLALCFREDLPASVQVVSLPGFLFHSAPARLLIYVAWYGLMIVILARSYGLYGPIPNRSGLNEQRLTVQSTLISGLLLCGTLYLARAEEISRDCRHPDDCLHGGPALRPARHLAEGGVQPLSRGTGDAQCLDCGRGPGGPRTAQSSGIASPPGVPLQGVCCAERTRGGIRRRGHYRRCAQLPVPCPLTFCRRDFLLGAGGKEAGDLPWWRRRALSGSTCA